MGGVTSLDQAEIAMLRLTCERAQIGDGMEVLDLGCGWGSFSLYAAEHFPTCKFTGVSNSNSQREYIMGKAKERGLTNIEIVTCDANVFRPKKRFDGVVTVEMFE